MSTEPDVRGKKALQGESAEAYRLLIEGDSVSCRKLLMKGLRERLTIFGIVWLFNDIFLDLAHKWHKITKELYDQITIEEAIEKNLLQIIQRSFEENVQNADLVMELEDIFQNHQNYPEIEWIRLLQHLLLYHANTSAYVMIQATQGMIESDPENEYFWYARARIEFDMKNNDVAQDCCSQSLKINPNCAITYVLQGKAIINSENAIVTSAFPYLEKAIQINPRCHTAYFYKGLAYSDLNMRKEAIDCYNKVLAVDPEDSLCHYNKGMLVEDEGDILGSIKHYQQAVEINPEYDDAYNNMGLAFIRIGKLKEAVSAFVNAIRINPYLIGAYNNCANVLKDLGDVQGALFWYNRGIDLVPDYAECYYNKAKLISEEFNNHQEAIELYKKAIKANPQHEIAHAALGSLLKKLDRYEEAIKSFKNHLELNSSDISSMIGIARCYYLLDDYERAVKYYDAALDIDDSIDEIYYEKGVILGALGKLQEGLDSLQKTIEINPMHGDAYEDAGRILEKLGQTKRALKYKKRARALKRLWYKNKELSVRRSFHNSFSQQCYYLYLDFL